MPELDGEGTGVITIFGYGIGDGYDKTGDGWGNDTRGAGVGAGYGFTDGYSFASGWEGVLCQN